MGAVAVTAPAKPRYGNFSIKKISETLKIDRATVAKRLDALRYRPVVDEAKLKLYPFDEAMESALLETSDKLGEVRVRKETAAARKIELQIAKEEGELGSVAEFSDIVQQLFGAMHKELAVRMPNRLANRLAKAKSSGEVVKILSSDIGKTFTTLRDDHEKYLKNGKAK